MALSTDCLTWLAASLVGLGPTMTMTELPLLDSLNTENAVKPLDLSCLIILFALAWFESDATCTIQPLPDFFDWVFVSMVSGFSDAFVVMTGSGLTAWAADI